MAKSLDLAALVETLGPRFAEGAAMSCRPCDMQRAMRPTGHSLGLWHSVCIALLA